MQKFLIVFAATLICLQVALIDSKYADSSEEYQYGYGGPKSLPGVGVIAQPILQAVTLHQPNYRNDLGINRLLADLVAKKDSSSQSSEDDKDDDDEEEDSNEKKDSDDGDSEEDERDSDDDDDRDSKEGNSRPVKPTLDFQSGNDKSPLCILFGGGYGPGQYPNPIKPITNWS